MLVLHAIWDNRASGRLHVWAESSTLDTSRRREQSERRQHPFAIAHDLLKDEICRVSPRLIVEKASPGKLTVLLPSTSEKPLPSPELIVTERNHEEAASLISWDIPTVVFDPYSAFNFLLSLPDHPPPKIVFGSSLRFWTETAKFLLELTAKQSFVPTLKEREEGTFRAFWEVVITQADEERIHVLSQAMPPVCRACNPSPDLLPIDILSDFLDFTVDAFVRKTVSSDVILPPRRSRRPKMLSLPEQWLEALSGESSLLTASDRDLKTFSQKLCSWIDQVKQDSAPLRLCFKLNLPDNGTDQWILRFYLQARDDRSLLIPAQKIWRVQAGVITFLKRKFENPQERLLTDLGKASRLYPEIEKSLRTAHPSDVKLTTEQAYAFLRQSAPLLNQSGFGVLLPPWWQNPAARLGVKLTVKQPPTVRGTGLLGIDGILAYEWRIAIGDETISVEEFRKLADLKVPLVKIRGQWVELRPHEIEKAIVFFEKQQSNGEISLGEALRLGLGQEESEVGLPVTDIEGEGKIREFLDNLLNSKMSAVDPPETFCGTLRPYQTRGLSWLWFLNQFGLGACLADDMGLGKTIQIIALVLHERAAGNPRPTLVICPMSVVGNWYKEVERFAPSLNVMVHHGQDRLTKSLKEEALNHDIIITTYALAHRDEEHLSAVKWDRIVLDEAQNIKNPWAKRTRAIKRLKARHRVALTGTPVENRLSELWSILDFLNKGYMGSHKEFHKKLAIPIERHHNEYHAETLRTLIKPFVLRRLKTDEEIIKDLPEKMEMRVFCNLTEEQATLYEAVVQEMLDKIGDSEGIQRKGLVLSTLMKLKQVCNHPAQFLHDSSSLEGRSGKVTRLKEMLEEVLAEKDKALIFTQFREMGGMLQQYLQEQLECETLFLHGGTAKKRRDIMIEQFQGEHKGKGPPLFVLSLKAGGLGLNLTAAHHVFHFDRWWNPAVENQATDRAFRIGQTKNVQVHKFVCIGTLEERIDAMIEQKKELADKIVGTGESWITEMSTEELRRLCVLNRNIGGG
jgi:SNF2 family DNA or RNA helicase